MTAHFKKNVLNTQRNLTIFTIYDPKSGGSGKISKPIMNGDPGISMRKICISCKNWKELHFQNLHFRVLSSQKLNKFCLKSECI